MISSYVLVVVVACVLAEPVLSKKAQYCATQEIGKEGAKYTRQKHVKLHGGRCNLDINPISHFLGCKPEKVKIKICDYKPNPTVEITSNLEKAKVRRVKPCPGDVVVDIWVACKKK